VTDRVHSLTIVLKHDIRVDELEDIETALKMIRGVLSVGRNISDHTEYVAQERATWELRNKIRDVLWPQK